MEVIEFMQRRRSVVARTMTGPGPSAAEIETILGIALRVPDHGKLAPWRIKVIAGSARDAYAAVLARAFAREKPDAGEKLVAFEAEKAHRAPVIVAVISVRDPSSKIPAIEQLLSAGALCQNLLIAAGGLGHAAQWITEWPAYNADVKRALGAAETDDIVGFVHIGTAAEPPKERNRPEPGSIVAHWTGPVTA